VSLDLTDAPKLERKPDPPKEKKKKDGAGVDTNAPPADAPVGKTSKKEKKVAEHAPSDSAPARADTSASAPVENLSNATEKAPKPKKEKKADANAPGEGGKKKGGAAAGGAAKTAAEEAGEPAPSMIDLRIGRIVDSECCYLRFVYCMHDHSQFKSTLMPTVCTSRSV
jgi:aminoacyl tRNA synthase complex-interacting multifunctional protein 1